jgi:hypothetical protein
MKFKNIIFFIFSFFIINQFCKAQWEISYNSAWVGVIKQLGDITLLSTGKGIAISTDKMENIRYVQTGLPAAAATDFARNSSGIFVSLYKKGIYFSSDSGKNWKYLGFDGDFVSTLLYHNNEIFAGVTDSKAESLGAYQWDPVNGKWINISYNLGDLGGGGVERWVYKLAGIGDYIFNGSEGGVFRMKIGSNHWEKISINFNLSEEDTRWLSSKGNRLIWSGASNFYSWYSDDLGETFHKFVYDHILLYAYEGNVEYIVKEKNPMYSCDNGLTWQLDTNGLPYHENYEDAIVRGMEIIDGIVYIGKRVGIYSKPVPQTSDVIDLKSRDCAIYANNNFVIPVSPESRSLAIYDIYGAEVYKSGIFNAQTEYITIPTFELNNGAYIIRVGCKNGADKYFKTIKY